MAICGIHQPNFLPWLPYFDKIDSVDNFILLDDVDYPKSGNSMGSWCNRVNIVVNKQDFLFTIPVVRKSGTQKIKDVEINYKLIDISKIFKTLKLNYGKYPNFQMVWQIFDESFSKKFQYLADFNVDLISRVMSVLSIKTNLFRQSELKNNRLTSNLMLCDLCMQTGSDTYLSGLGASTYMDGRIFLEKNLKVIYQKYMYKDVVEKIKNYSIFHFLIVTEREYWRDFNVKP